MGSGTFTYITWSAILTMSCSSHFDFSNDIKNTNFVISPVFSKMDTFLTQLRHVTCCDVSHFNIPINTKKSKTL